MTELVRAKEAAALLGVTKQAIHDRQRRGNLPAIRVGRAVYVPESAVREALARKRGTSP